MVRVKPASEELPEKNAIIVYLDDETIKTLADYCYTVGCSRSQLVNAMVLKYFAGNDFPKTTQQQEEEKQQ